mmetsp:Transcript_32341/g.65604  ORF Transcript_32341/g.65604 Transcript_32341/m.65604 type:complete len:358 (+) Transcript_32341:148-1221(+)
MRRQRKTLHSEKMLFRLLFLFLAATASDSAVTDPEGDSIVQFYSILSPCPDDPRDSPLDGIIDFWRHVGPKWSPLADIGILLAVLGLVIPLLCVVVGAGFCIYYVKETIVGLYLGFWGEQLQGEIIGTHTQNWANPQSGTQYCRATARYGFDETTRHRKVFVVEKLPPRTARLDLLVSRRHPKLSRIQNQQDMMILIFAKLVGLILISCAVGGILLTMIIQLVPPVCPYKMQLWVAYTMVYICYVTHLLHLEICNGASYADGTRSDGLWSQWWRRRDYEYVPDSPHVTEDRRPPTALPVAEPISGAGISSLFPVAVTSPVRSIFGFHRTRTVRGSDSQEEVPAALATVAHTDMNVST